MPIKCINLFLSIYHYLNFFNQIKVQLFQCINLMKIAEDMYITTYSFYESTMKMPMQNSHKITTKYLLIQYTKLD
jgi:hypothetical protein